MATRPVSLLIAVLAVAIVVAGGILAYTSTVHQAASQPSQVTWRDPVGNPITSLTLVSSDPSARSKLISFTCNPSVGEVKLQFSSSIPSLKASQSSFASCNTTANYVTLSVSSTNTVSSTVTLQLVQSDIYKTLPGQLTITVRVS